MECQLKISPNCENTIKGRQRYINGKVCCYFCYYKQKQEDKKERKNGNSE